MKKKWMALVRIDGNKRADWDVVARNVSRDDAMKAAIERCKSLGVAYKLGYKFDNGSQQIIYADGYDGSPILGKVIPQSDDKDDIHAVPWVGYR